MLTFSGQLLTICQSHSCQHKRLDSAAAAAASNQGQNKWRAEAEAGAVQTEKRMEENKENNAIIFISGLPPVPHLKSLLLHHISTLQQSNTAEADHSYDAAQKSKVKLKLAINSFNHTRGYAHITMPSSALASSLLPHLHLSLLSSHLLSASLHMGKLDFLFPYIPPAIRSKLKLDATAMFSVTDQESAQRIIQICAAAAHVGNLRLEQQHHINSIEIQTSMECMPDVSANDSNVTVPSSSSRSSSPITIISHMLSHNWGIWWDILPAHELPASFIPPPVYQAPFSVGDYCACAGGTALPFARHFSRCTAIELDKGRCQLLYANGAQLGVGSKLSVVEADAVKMLLEGRVKQDIVFIDPPWSVLSSTSHLLYTVHCILYLYMYIHIYISAH